MRRNFRLHRQAADHLATAALCISMALATNGPARAEGDDANRLSTLTVTATGRVSATPDLARITVGVQGLGPTAESAMQENTLRMQAVLDAMKQAGIGNRDMATSNLSLAPHYDYRNASEPRITGYQASNQMTVTVRKVESLGAVLDSIVRAGANTIVQVSFDLADKSQIQEEARIEAAKGARKKAEDYASAIGTEILGLISLSESGGGVPRPYPMADMRMNAMAESAPVPVAGGDLDVGISVTAVFELRRSLAPATAVK